MPRTRTAVLGAACLFAACTTPAQPAPVSTRSAAAPTPAPQPPDAAPPLVAAPPAAPAAPDAAPTELVPTALPDAEFHVAALRDGALELRLLGDQVFVHGAGGLAHLDDGGRLVTVEYGLTGQALPWHGFDAWLVHAFGGRWPDNAWLVTGFDASRSGTPPYVHRRDGATWKQLPNKERLLYKYYSSIVPWHAGQVLGLRAYQVDPDIYEDVLEVPPRTQKKIDAQLAAVRRGFDLLAAKPTPTTMTLDPALREVLAVAAAPTGELFALATTAEYAGKSRVQRWGLTGAAAVAGSVDELPDELSCESLAVRAADEAYVGCRRAGEPSVATLLRFTGAAWTEVPAPPGRAVFDLSVSPEGALWAVVATGRSVDDQTLEALWHRDSDGAAWQQAALPELRFPDVAADRWTYQWGSLYLPIPGDPTTAARTWTPSPKQVLARGPNDVWVVARTGMTRGGEEMSDAHRHVVLRTAATVGEPLPMLDDNDLNLELRDWRSADPWTPKGCPDDDDPTFVALRTLPGNAPRDQPEPLLEAFVQQNPGLLANIQGIYEVHHRGRRTVGLFVDLSDQTAADTLLAALERVAPGERRTLECRRPRARRAFDKQTGKPLSAPAM